MAKLLGLLIFDHLNDVIYIRCNRQFIQHVQTLAITRGLLPGPMINLGIGATESEDPLKQDISNLDQGCLDPNVVVQLFSPLVTSHHIMGTQFKNSYESVSCEDGTTLVFQEYSSFLFLCVGTYSESYLHRFTNVSMQMVQLIVGPCVSLIKSNREKSKTLDNLLTAWLELYSNEQSYLVEAIERLIVSPEISSTSISALSAIVDTIVKKRDVGSAHAMFFIRNKLLTLYSSKSAEELSEADMLYLNLLLKANALKDVTFSCLNTPFQEETTIITTPTPDEGRGSGESEETEEEGSEDLGGDLSPTLKEGIDLTTTVKEYNFLLKTKSSPFSPHIVYLYPVTSELSLVVAAEVNRSQLAGQLLEVFTLLEDLKNEECNFKEVPFVDIVDNCLRKFQDFMMWLPKTVYPKVKKSLIQVWSRWESLKKGSLEEWLKCPSDSELPSRLEAGVSAVIDAIRVTWSVACLNVSSANVLKSIESASLRVKQRMGEFTPSFEPKALRNMSLGSCSIISINKYLEEFPGLVHFLYIDRSVHQLTAPMLWIGDHQQEETAEEQSEAAWAVRRLTAAKIWSMVDFARDHLSKGHTSLLWKDKTFSYSYFLWFEDQGGNPLKPITFDKEALEDLPLPGILCGDFYRAFAAKAFPDTSPNRLRVFELFCIHLGMTTSPCILEQTRRLSATVWEIAGPSSTNPIDLL